MKEAALFGQSPDLREGRDPEVDGLGILDRHAGLVKIGPEVINIDEIVVAAHRVDIRIGVDTAALITGKREACLFADLAEDGIKGAFAGLDAAARHLPRTGSPFFRQRTPGDEETVIGTLDQRQDNQLILAFLKEAALARQGAARFLFFIIIDIEVFHECLSFCRERYPGRAVPPRRIPFYNEKSLSAREGIPDKEMTNTPARWYDNSIRLLLF